MKQDVLRVGIVGTGWIADKAAITLTGLTECEAYAVGSRSQATADQFAAKWNIGKAYGSYSKLIADPDVDLIYVATPHSHHYDVTREAILAGKPCLVEKAFMANLRQSKEIISLAHEHGVFVAEAIWTRYQPAVGMVRKMIADGRIGEPRLITATLGYSMGNKERIMRPDLCGGALLDLGVYALNFVRMFTDADIASIDGHCVKSATGMDLTNAITAPEGTAKPPPASPNWGRWAAPGPPLIPPPVGGGRRGLCRQHQQSADHHGQRSRPHLC